MLQQKNTKSPLDSVKATIWNLVLYFFYFYTLLFWMRFIGVCAQGNRGVVINNQKFDDSSGIQYVQTNSISTLKPSTVVPSVTWQVIIVKGSYHYEGVYLRSETEQSLNKKSVIATVCPNLISSNEDRQTFT